MNATYTVRTRYGWGWEVRGPAGASCPIETAIAAQEFADARNAGKSHEEAVLAAGLSYHNRRFYVTKE